MKKKKKKLHNHICPKFSPLEEKMVVCIPVGGNWKNIPENIPSERLKKIRQTGGRTTLYGRLRPDQPSYTISTYFNRMGNGTFIHPDQDRLISIREAARLQSFPDDFIFKGSKTSQYKQIGNAVPVLLARAVAEELKKYTNNRNIVDLFCGIGGLSKGFNMEGFNTLGAIEIDKNIFETYLYNHGNKETFINGDITNHEIKDNFVKMLQNEKIGIIVGGPPCQGFSLAGLRIKDDPRNQLFLEYVDIVDKLQPEIFVMENVPGILSMNKGKDFQGIINKFKEIGYYINSIFKLNAEDYGVPQKRKRIMIIGTKNDIKINEPKKIFGGDNLPGFITVNEALGGLPSLKAGTGEVESDIEYKAQSTYEKLMMGEITFNEFYDLISKGIR